jgi:small subunit ribosomal protein S16
LIFENPSGRFLTGFSFPLARDCVKSGKTPILYKISLVLFPGFDQLPRPPARANHATRKIMSVSLRLNRKGTKDRPYYKIVAVDSRKRRDGRYIEQLGTYDPLLEGTNYEIDLEKADKWLSVGAKPSETVNSFIRKARTAAAK